jgi:periplasmic divalent cation tolerance protein
VTSQFRIVFVTVPNTRSAETIAQGLVQGRLAACVNIIPKITSIYRWEGKLCKDAEVLMLIKTRASILNNLIRVIKANHPAQIPEIIAVAITKGNSSYLKWLDANTTS